MVDKAHPNDFALQLYNALTVTEQMKLLHQQQLLKEAAAKAQNEKSFKEALGWLRRQLK